LYLAKRPLSVITAFWIDSAKEIPKKLRKNGEKRAMVIATGRSGDVGPPHEVVTIPVRKLNC
jgi:hypothetical protein